MYHWYDFENRKRGPYSFPVEFHHVDENHQRYIMPFHWHNECEFIRILQGSMILTLNNKNFKLTPDTILFIPNNIVHGAFPDKCIYECIVFDLNTFLQSNTFVGSYTNLFTQKAKIQNIFTSDQKEVFTIINSLFEAMKNHLEGYKISTIGCIFQFLGIVAQKNYYKELTTKKDLEETNNNDKFEKVFALIRKKYNQCITLEDMAREANMSDRYFCQVFKTQTHYTPIEYLMNYRIEYAKYLLCTKALSVSEVSYKVGFNSVAYFIKVFKKITGVTPKKYEK